MGRTGKAVSVKVSVHQLNPSHTFIEMDFIPSQLQGSLNGQAAKKSQCNQTRIGVGLYFQPLENILTLRLGQIAFLLALSRLRFRRKLLRRGAFKGIVPFAIMPLQTISPKLIQRIFCTVRDVFRGYELIDLPLRKPRHGLIFHPLEKLENGIAYGGR